MPCPHQPFGVGLGEFPATETVELVSGRPQPAVLGDPAYSRRAAEIHTRQ
ncbi:hypothetical protein GCM10018771_66150 [Streptomyces cellulosae]|nr:hypothetical protein GCM10018771_66150 [Streptomyces cellulosae]